MNVFYIYPLKARDGKDAERVRTRERGRRIIKIVRHNVFDTIALVNHIDTFVACFVAHSQDNEQNQKQQSQDHNNRNDETRAGAAGARARRYVSNIARWC